MPSTVAVPTRPDRRIPALDGLRGLMTILVLVSHYFAELPGGIGALGFGWIAVDMFFVLSGFLVGRLILEKGDHANFYTVFYLRRLFRTVPIYLVAVVASVAAFSLAPAAWSDLDAAFPLSAYLTFTQNFEMAWSGEIGAHWLAPTWTLAVEEQFYLVAPALMLMVPPRHLTAVLGTVIAGSVLYKGAVLAAGQGAPMALVMLPGRADTLAIGLLAAVVWVRARPALPRFALLLRAGPIGLLAVVSILKIAGGDEAFVVFGHTITGVASALFILAIMIDAPEARRLEGPVLRFFGVNSYAVYLTHLPVLWLVHGLWFGTPPTLQSVGQVLLILACMPMVAGLSLVLTRTVEAPLSAYGRSFGWSERRVVRAGFVPVRMGEGG